MHLFRVGDRHKQEHSFFKGNREGVNIKFFSFGKGDEKSSDFEILLDIRDIVSLVSEMSFMGSSEARKIEAFMRGGSEFRKYFETIDFERARELEEDANINTKQKPED